VNLTRRFSGAVGATVLAALLLASCSSSPKPTTVTITPGSIVSYSAGRNARGDVTAKTCTQAGGSWVLSGSVKNPTKTATGFRIVVDFVSKPGSTVLSSSEVTVASVSPGASVDWTATGAHGKTNVGCIVRQAETT
jgi:hypothetical protein